MSLFRFFSIIFFLGFFSVSGNLLAASNGSASKINPNGSPILYQVPDNPDMPSGDPNGPDRIASRQVPDNPDMPSADPDGPDTIAARSRQVPDNPDMPSGDPNGPDGHQRANPVSAPTPASLWDRAFGWLQSLLNMS